ncbi:MAG: hypothetical protein K6U74_15530 [Firmicutes bacterium]|nr:hypothetical protein [Bacillota bacterium]
METLLCCIFLVLFMFIVVNTVYMIQDKVHLIRIARDAGRESVIVGGDLDTGYAVAKDRARMYFSDSDNVQVDLQLYGGKSVVCQVSYPYKLFGNLFPKATVTLAATAVFGYRDIASGYD